MELKEFEKRKRRGEIRFLDTVSGEVVLILGGVPSNIWMIAGAEKDGRRLDVNIENLKAVEQ